MTQRCSLDLRYYFCSCNKKYFMWMFYLVMFVSICTSFCSHVMQYTVSRGQKTAEGFKALSLCCVCFTIYLCSVHTFHRMYIFCTSKPWGQFRFFFQNYMWGKKDKNKTILERQQVHREENDWRDTPETLLRSIGRYVWLLIQYLLYSSLNSLIATAEMFPTMHS